MRRRSKRPLQILSTVYKVKLRFGSNFQSVALSGTNVHTLDHIGPCLRLHAFICRSLNEPIYPTPTMMQCGNNFDSSCKCGRNQNVAQEKTPSYAHQKNRSCVFSPLSKKRCGIPDVISVNGATAKPSSVFHPPSQHYPIMSSSRSSSIASIASLIK
jgi:hypothetical protein